MTSGVNMMQAMTEPTNATQYMITRDEFDNLMSSIAAQYDFSADANALAMIWTTLKEGGERVKLKLKARYQSLAQSPDEERETA